MIKYEHAWQNDKTIPHGSMYTVIVSWENQTIPMHVLNSDRTFWFNTCKPRESFFFYQMADGRAESIYNCQTPLCSPRRRTGCWRFEDCLVIHIGELSSLLSKSGIRSEERRVGKECT